MDRNETGLGIMSENERIIDTLCSLDKKEPTERAYFFFLQDEKIQQWIFRERSKNNFMETLNLVLNKWKTMPKNQKRPYIKMAENETFENEFQRGDSRIKVIVPISFP